MSAAMAAYRDETDLVTARHASTVPFRIEVFDRYADAAPAWRQLQEVAPCSPYQQFGWVQAWSETVGTARDIRPTLVVGFDEGGRPVALLPLGTTTRAGVLRVAEFLGGQDSNCNMGLFAEPARYDAAAIRSLFLGIAAVAGIDLFSLRNQPAAWATRPNPLAVLPGQPSPSVVFTTQGPFSGEPLSKHARKGFRQKERWLNDIGPVEYRHAVTECEIDVVLNAFVAQRAARAQTTGVPLPTEMQTAFYRRAAVGGETGPSMDLSALWCGGAPVATFGGTGHGERYSGMILAMDAQPAIARCSPGELLLRHVVADLHTRGFASFDLGIGEARYKHLFCDGAEPLFDTFFAVTRKGAMAAAGYAALARTKRRFKNSPAGMARLRQLRTAWRQLRSPVSSP